MIVYDRRFNRYKEYYTNAGQTLDVVRNAALKDKESVASFNVTAGAKPIAFAVKQPPLQDQ